jgi:NodT family efflux transporter outer membrane factor (OMF) lipoprotein
MADVLRLRRTASVVALAAALGACTTVGPNFSRPAPPATASYLPAGETGPAQQQARPGAEVAAEWWSYFRSPDLDQVMRMAVENSPTLQAAEATLAAAQAQIAATRAEAAPQVTANGGANAQRLNLASFGFDTSAFPGLDPNPQFVLYSVGAAVSYALDPWGMNRRQVEGAAARAEAEGYNRDAAYLSLTGNVALQAAQIAAARAQLATVEAVIADDQRMIDLVRKAEAAGAEPAGPRVSAQAQLASDTARLPALRQQLAAARHAMSVLAGRAPADWTPPDFDLDRLTLPAEIPLSLPSELVRRRPDILAAEARLHAATADVGVATARLYPSINLTASLTQSALSLENLFKTTSTSGALGGDIAGPIFDAGRRRALRKGAEETARAALATYQATVVQAFGQVADLLQALAHDEEELAAQGRARDSAEASLRLARAAYQGGATGLLPVVDAERQYNNARLAYVRAQAQRYVHTVQLFVATGAGLKAAGPPAA